MIRVNPAEVSEVIIDPHGEAEVTVGGTQTRTTALEKFERAQKIPEDECTRTVLSLRGDQGDRLYYKLVKDGLAGRSMPDESEVEEGCDVPEPKRMRHVASPMKRNPSEEEREAKKKLEQLAFANPEWMKLANDWKEDWMKLKELLKHGGFVVERDEDDNAIECMDRGKAISDGKKKAKEKHALELKKGVTEALKKGGTETEKRKRVEGSADGSAVSALKTEIRELTYKNAALELQVESLKSDKATLTSTTSMLQKEVTSQTQKAQRTFQYLCKQEVKTGRLEGELMYLRPMFFKEFPDTSRRSSPPDSEGSQRRGSFGDDMSPPFPGGSQPRLGTFSSQLMAEQAGHNE